MTALPVARATLALLIAVACPGALLGQTHADVILGRVTGDSGQAVAGAQVIATRAPDRAGFRAVTDSGGRYRIVVDSGTGDYLVHISLAAQPTWPAYRKRVTRTTPADSVFVVNAVLKAPAARAAQQLAAVTVQARKPTPRRGDDSQLGPGVGASEQQPQGVSASLAPEDRGDLTALALTLPGITPSGSGFAVLGVANQNSTTLNGMSFPGATLPRDAQTRTTVATSTYDPSNGWFGGAQTRVNLGTGGIFSTRDVHVTFDSPTLQYGDPVSARLGQQFTRTIASLGGQGMTARDKLTYNYGLDLTRQTSAAPTLAGLDPAVLQRVGVSVDSAARLLQLMNAAHIPVSAAGAPASRTTNTVTFTTRLNTPEYDVNTFADKPTATGLILYGSHSQIDAAQASATSTPARDGQTTNTSAQVQGVFSGFVTKDLLEDLHSSLSWSEQRGTPYLQLPAGSVLVGSTFPDGTPGVTSLGFGGAPIATTSRTFGWETQSETKFYAPGKPKHRVKIDADARYDAVSSVSNANANGTFLYNSLSDFAANSPASFSRALNAPQHTGAVWNGYASVGDYYRVSQNFQLLYGARLEGNVFSERPAYNPAVDAAFGARTDYAPNTVGVSPRAGFTWNYTRKPTGGGIMFNQIGQFIFPQLGQLRGGIGEFRSMMPASLLANAAATTGLPNAYRQVSCFGSAVPTPDWSSYAASPENIPTDCAGGAPAAALGDTAPAVQLIDHGYNAPRSWRGNLAWTASHSWLVWTVEGVAAYNVNQPGQTDLNFDNASRFALGDEGRAIYVQPGSIVPATGVLSPLDARTDQAFGQVLDTRSDLRSEARQLTVTLSPDLSHTRQNVFGSIAYTLQSVQQIQSGFDGSTFGSPVDRYWSRSPLDIRHTFILQAGVQWKYVGLSLYSHLRSGAPFTPVVGSDVNGDGLANDRAFVFDPATATDPTLAANTRALLASAAPGVRRCLESQMGRAAAPSSCEGPWTADLNAQLRINTYRFGEPWKKFNIAINLANPLGGLDQLLHGSHLQGWGNAALPSPVLYYVRGFDPNSMRYLYTVNPRFGDTRPTNTALQAPFRVTLDVAMSYGPAVAVQQLDRFLRPGRDGYPGTKLGAEDLRKRYARNVPDPYRPILQESDSLLLTTDQLRAITELQRAYNAKVDSVWMAMTTWMAALPDHFDANAVTQRQEATIDQVWEMGRIELQTQLPHVLSPVQLQMLPSWSASFYKAKSMKGTRMFVMGSP